LDQHLDDNSVEEMMIEIDLAQQGSLHAAQLSVRERAFEFD
jgi:hypothetical protein